MRAVLVFVGLVVAGALSSFGFEPLAGWPLTFLAVAFLLDRIAQARTFREAFRTGWLFAVGHFLVGLTWIATAFTYQANMPASFGVGAVVLLSLYLALFPAISAAVAWHVYRERAENFGEFLFAYLHELQVVAGHLANEVISAGCYEKTAMRAFSRCHEARRFEDADRLAKRPSRHAHVRRQLRLAPDLKTDRPAFFEDLVFEAACDLYRQSGLARIGRARSWGEGSRCDSCLRSHAFSVLIAAAKDSEVVAKM